MRNKKHMEKTINYKLTPIASAVAFAVVAFAQPAFAQQTPSGQLETIVVTANKRVEKLESVPVSMSVLTEAAIARNNIREIEDVVALTPALNLNAGSAPANNAIYLRGIGTTTNTIALEADVSVIVDDVPVAQQFQAFKDLADVSRIEVLKGPQSTLFGKASIAGVISVVTKPISGPLVSRGSALITNDGEWRLGASFGGKVSDSLGVRVSASDTNFRGNLHNLTTGKDTNGSGGKAFMAKVDWHPTSNLDFVLNPHYSFEHNSRGAVALDSATIKNTATGQTQAAGAGLSNTLGAGGTSIPFYYTVAGQSKPPATSSLFNKFPASTTLAGITPGPWNQNIRRDIPSSFLSFDRGASFRVNYNLANGATLSSISSIDKTNTYDRRDQDFLDVPVIVRPPNSTTPATDSLAGLNGSLVPYIQGGSYDIRAKTQEFRLVSSDTGSVRYVVGAWFAKNETYRFLARGLCVAPTVCSSAIQAGTSSYLLGVNPVVYAADFYNVNKALFGQVDWNFAPTYTLVTGFRNNLETSGFHYTRNFNTDMTAQTIVPYTGAGSLPGQNRVESLGNAERSYTGKLSLQKQFNKQWMGYAAASTGHKGEAYDLSSTTSPKTTTIGGVVTPVLDANGKAVAQNAAAPEQAQSMELGFKANLSNRMSLNGSLFNTEFFHYQNSVTVVDPSTNVSNVLLSSVPRVRTRGFELDTAAMVTPQLQVNGALAYTEATIQEWKNGPCYADATNTVASAANPTNSLTPGSVSGRNRTCTVLGGGVTNEAGQPMQSAPKIRINVGTAYDVLFANLPINGFVNANWSYTGSSTQAITQDPASIVPTYTIANLGFGIREKKDFYKVSFDIKNLFNHHYYSASRIAGGNVLSQFAATGATVSGTNWAPARDTWRYYSLKLEMKY